MKRSAFDEFNLARHMREQIANERAALAIVLRKTGEWLQAHVRSDSQVATATQPTKRDDKESR